MNKPRKPEKKEIIMYDGSPKYEEDVGYNQAIDDYEAWLKEEWNNVLQMDLDTIRREYEVFGEAIIKRIRG